MKHSTLLTLIVYKVLHFIPYFWTMNFPCFSCSSVLSLCYRILLFCGITFISMTGISVYNLNAICIMDSNCTLSRILVNNYPIASTNMCYQSVLTTLHFVQRCSLIGREKIVTANQETLFIKMEDNSHRLHHRTSNNQCSFYRVFHVH